MVLGALGTAAVAEQLAPPPVGMVNDLLDTLLSQMVGSWVGLPSRPPCISACQRQLKVRLQPALGKSSSCVQAQ